MAVFVKGAVRGELCRIKLLKVLKNAAFARIEEILEPSEHRRQPDCPYFGRCGGCDFRHMDYAEELKLKKQRVDDALSRIGGLDIKTERIIGADEPDACRNKAIYTVRRGADGKAQTGFYRRRTHELIAVERCLLLPEQCDMAAAGLRAWMDKYGVSAYDEKERSGVVRSLMVRVTAAGDVMACVSANADALPREKELIKTLREACPGIKGIVLDINKKPGNVVPAGIFRTLWGEAELTETLCGLKFQLSPKSFFQVNRAQAERLYDTAAAFCAPEGKESVLDLYCGTGTISLLMARRAGGVTGVEIVEQAVEDARENAKRNGIENAVFRAGDAGEIMAEMAKNGPGPDAVIVDPPRKGLSQQAVDAVAKAEPERIVYVSCDPATLARDLARFAEQGYRTDRAVAVDMFPRTANVETICCLYHQKKDFISVPYEPKNADYLQQLK